MIAYSIKDYQNSYFELLEIIKHLPSDAIERIPKSKIDFYRQNSSKDSEFIYNEDLDIDEQNISHLTEIIFANLYINYLATISRKKEIIEKDRIERAKIEEEKRTKYNPDDLFKNKRQETIKNNNEVKDMVVLKRENHIKRIVSKLKEFFKKLKKI